MSSRRAIVGFSNLGGRVSKLTPRLRMLNLKVIDVANSYNEAVDTPSEHPPNNSFVKFIRPFRFQEIRDT